MDWFLTLSSLSLAFEGVVAVLLIAMIYFAIKLNSRIGQMRERESQMQQLIDSLNEAAGRAEASVGHLKTAGEDAETTLRGSIERARALRDDLMFMIDRGDGMAEKVALNQTAPAKFHQPPTPEYPAPVGQPAADDDSDLFDESPELESGASRAERELVRAIRSSRGDL